MNVKLILFSALLFLSCGNATSNEAGSDEAKEGQQAKVDKTKVKEVERGEMKSKLSVGEESSEPSISYEFYVNLDSSYKVAANRLISEFVFSHCNYDKKLDENVVLDTTFLRVQLNSFMSLAKAAAEEYEELMPWEMDMSLGIDTTQFNSIEVHVGAWTYTGGAHGNGESYVYHIDRKSGKRLILADFFNNLEELTSIGEKFFRISQELTVDESLEDSGFEFYDGFYLSKNFSFDDEFLYVGYNVYEIGPYVMGPVDFEIPLSEIKHLLKRK